MPSRTRIDTRKIRIFMSDSKYAGLDPIGEEVYNLLRRSYDVQELCQVNRDAPSRWRAIVRTPKGLVSLSITYSHASGGWMIA